MYESKTNITERKRNSTLVMTCITQEIGPDTSVWDGGGFAKGRGKDI
jgi:hypothetical protein